jgi:predicted heme/steroid binding protein
MKKISKAELARCDGREGRPAYIAYQGKVYDVAGSFLWKGGRHQAMHDAGMDLTGILDRAPHGADLLERVPAVGILAED